MHEPVLIEMKAEMLVIRFVRPERRNCLSEDVFDVLEKALIVPDTLEKVIFTGTDNIFLSGADLKEIAVLQGEDARKFGLRGQRLMNSIASIKQTTIAAINGYCYGGGLDLAMACDRRTASPNATFCHPGANLGIMTGFGGTQRLPALVGPAKALEMLFTAEPISANEALRAGLIDQIENDPLSAAINY